jgi:hypothetical protein
MSLLAALFNMTLKAVFRKIEANKGGKILGSISGPVKEKGLWRISTDQELIHLYREPDFISEIIKGRLRWLEHVERMS